jgi:hypothetical protein
MVTLREFFELIDYRITEGSEYGWQCYGPNAYSLDSWAGDQDGASFTVVFDKNTQAVYEAQAHDYKHNRAYRLINPDFKFKHNDEAVEREVSVDQAWDNVKFTDLEVDDDFIQKCLAIKSGQDYDTRVQIVLDLDRDLLFRIMVRAHEQDITLNQMIEKILQETINFESSSI